MSQSGLDLPVVALLIPALWRERILSPEAERELAAVATIRGIAGSADPADDLSALCDQAVVCLTGWGTPPLSEELLAANPTLQLVAHTAGSIRRLLPAAAMKRGLRVSHAAAIIADAVAEFVVSQALCGLRHLHEIDQAMKRGDDWHDLHEHSFGRLLGGQTVGVIGAGYVGRQVIRLLRAFGCDVLLYDPLLASDAAAELGVKVVALKELFARSVVVSLHAPALPETLGMVGAAELALLPDGAVFVNTARGALVDHEALAREVASGRIFAALDVFDPEPLPVDAPLRGRPNVLLSPHIAGHTCETHRRQGQAMIDEVRRFLRGEPLRYEVTPAMMATMA
jgi:phosphoglycerate dehydrogenase-like enzyme